MATSIGAGVAVGGTANEATVRPTGGASNGEASGTAHDALGVDFFYGWDLLYRTVEDAIDKKSDVLMVLAHFLLTKHCSFRCIGIGDDKSGVADEDGTELLPDHWNGDSTKYALRYLYNKALYLLLAHITDDVMIFNLLDVATKNVSNLCVTPDSLVTNLRGGIAKIMPTAVEIIGRFRKELCDPIFAGNQRETPAPQPTAQTPAQTVDPLLVDARHPTAYAPIGNPYSNPYSMPNVGHGDLDPLNSGGTGNLYTFPQAPRPQRPNVPGQDPPNPDHAQPPDYNPDQYM